MKKSFLSIFLLLSIGFTINAQIGVNSIKNNQTELLINDSLSIKKGQQLQIYLPAGTDFIFIKQKKSALSAKLLGKVADIAGTGASAVGIGSGNIKVLQGATKVLNTANAVHYGADAIEKINDLPISKDAKKIAGKKMDVQDWTFSDDGWVVNAIFEKKKFEIYLQEALISGEIVIN